MTGDVIYVFGEMDEDGFYMGQLAGTGARGLVPSNFLAEAAHDHLAAGGMMTAAGQQQHMQPMTGFGSSVSHDKDHFCSLSFVPIFFLMDDDDRRRRCSRE